mmetsp:Transcript_44081/g.70457  ORF Transcript_44081/g.70457 Transcript_44081/m.70457 type:complete len:438 (-) Transcript_44081:50-1363(-)
MKTLTILAIASVAQGALLVSKSSIHAHVSVPIVQDDSQENVVGVAEPEVVTDSSENKVLPSKALAQTAAKIVDTGKGVSEFTEAKITTNEDLAVDAGSNSEDEEVVKVATADVVQDTGSIAKVEKSNMTAKIEFEGDDDVVKTVDADVVANKNDDKKMQLKEVQNHAGEKPASPSEVRMVAPEIVAEAPRVEAQIVQDKPVLEDDDDVVEAPLRKEEIHQAKNTSSVAKVEARVVQVDHVLEDATVLDALNTVRAETSKHTAAVQVAVPKVKVAPRKPLNALAIKRNLRGPDIDENGVEYVDPSEVKYNGQEEYVTVVPYPGATEEPTQQAKETRSVGRFGNGQVVEADVVPAAALPQDSKSQHPKPRHSALQKNINTVVDLADTASDAEDEKTREAPVPEDSSDDEEESQPTAVGPQAQKKQRDCSGGSEFNENEC